MITWMRLNKILNSLEQKVNLILLLRKSEGTVGDIESLPFIESVRQLKGS